MVEVVPEALGGAWLPASVGCISLTLAIFTPSFCDFQLTRQCFRRFCTYDKSLYSNPFDSCAKL
jgi:hypothetical protein